MMKILDELAGASRIAIGGHVRPDGDCVGACMGLSLYLKKEMPDARVDVYLERPADVFSCLAGIDEIHTQVTAQAEEAGPYDVFIVLDCADDRLGEFRKFFLSAKKTINIDHHITNGGGCAMVNDVDPQASSTSELVYDLLKGEEREAQAGQRTAPAGRKDPLDPQIALALYLGIVHDTGVFQYSNTSPHTLQAAADLIRYGFDFSRVIEQTFYEKTWLQNQILGRALLESVLFMDGKCIVSAMDQKTLQFYHATPQDLEGIVSQLRMTTGVECAIFMYETHMQEYKVSLRSRGLVDVAAVAATFGGGGHVRAAGCTMQGTWHDCVNNLSLYIERQLRERESPGGNR